MSHPARTAWLAYWGARQRYHRYSVVGLHRLLRSDPVLMVGYHGRPTAFDQCMLSVTLYRELGYLPHGVIHGSMQTNPMGRWIQNGLGFVTGDGPEIARAVERGEHICVQPGGTREGCRSVRHKYRLDWGRRRGYLKLAARYGLPIVPVAARGVDDAWIGLNDGYRWGKRLGAPAGVPLWLGVGVVGLWPMASPLPVRITQHIGEPLSLDIDPDDPDSIERAHTQVATALQALVTRINQ